jgi:hypothetical protein
VCLILKPTNAMLAFKYYSYITTSYLENVVWVQ